jgi:hypothetical protein
LQASKQMESSNLTALCLGFRQATGSSAHSATRHAARLDWDGPELGLTDGGRMKQLSNPTKPVRISSDFLQAGVR